MRRSRLLPILLLSTALLAAAADLEPTLKNVKYGPPARNVLNFWKADSATPTPVMMLIHGGGWGSGNKREKIPSDFYLPKGISVVSITYRLNKTDILPAPVYDAARALRVVESPSPTSIMLIRQDARNTLRKRPLRSNREKDMRRLQQYG